MTAKELRDLPIVVDTYEQTFDLADDAQREYYEWVVMRERNAWFVVYHRDRKWNDTNTNQLIYMEWGQPYVELPAGKQTRSVLHARDSHFTLSSR
jgi:hypothetical protein